MSADIWGESPGRFLLPLEYQEVAGVIGWDRAVDFGMKVWRLKRPPSRFSSGPNGGSLGYIYIPKNFPASLDHELIRLAGVDVARLLVNAFAGMQLKFPGIERTSIPRRNLAIVHALGEGMRTRAVAAGFGLTSRQICRIAAAKKLRPST